MTGEEAGGWPEANWCPWPSERYALLPAAPAEPA